MPSLEVARLENAQMHAGPWCQSGWPAPSEQRRGGGRLASPVIHEEMSLTCAERQGLQGWWCRTRSTGPAGGRSRLQTVSAVRGPSGSHIWGGARAARGRGRAPASPRPAPPPPSSPGFSARCFALSRKQLRAGCHVKAARQKLGQ